MQIIFHLLLPVDSIIGRSRTKYLKHENEIY